MLRCIFCGFCEDACPTEAIVLGDKYELSFYDRGELDLHQGDAARAGRARTASPPRRKTEPGKFTRSVPIMRDPQD